MEAAVFQRRLQAWKRLEEEKGQDLTPSALERKSGVNKGYWSMWLNGTGKARSQQIPSASQWEQLRLAMGFGWHYAFEDVYSGVKEITIPNRTCPICASEFHASGRQVYDVRFCKFVAKCLRDDDKRKSPAAALRVV